MSRYISLLQIKWWNKKKVTPRFFDFSHYFDEKWGIELRWATLTHRWYVICIKSHLLLLHTNTIGCISTGQHPEYIKKALFETSKILVILSPNRFMMHLMITGWYWYACIDRMWACIHHAPTSMSTAPSHVSLYFTFAKKVRKTKKKSPPVFSIFCSISMKSEESNWDGQVSPIDDMISP